MDDLNVALFLELNILIVEINKLSGFGVFFFVFFLIMRMCNF